MGKVLQMATKPGKIDTTDMVKAINKKLGIEAAYDLEHDNPASIKDWIPTGSSLLDWSIYPGKKAGIPVGRITELAGLSSAGKSFMATIIAANANKMGMKVVYFDAEAAVDRDFLEKAGCDMKEVIYMQAISVEKVLGTVEFAMEKWPEQQLLFIWDSVAATPTERDVEGDFNPQSSMAVKPRVLSLAFKKLQIPLERTQSTLLLLNQLKTNMGRPAEVMTTPYFTPGGKSIVYHTALRIWLTRRKAKAGRILDENGTQIGSEVKARIEKVRSAGYGRECIFNVMWGGDKVKIADEESWLHALSNMKTDRYKASGAWKSVFDKAGKEYKFQSKDWMAKLKEKEFRTVVLSIMEEEFIEKYK
jgi:recombination protein RecA